MRWLEIALLVLIALRSALDVFSDVALDWGLARINVPSVFVLLSLSLGLIYLSALFLRGELKYHRILFIFGFWVASLFAWSYLADIRYGGKGLVGIREWVRLLSLLVVFAVCFQLAHTRSYRFVLGFVLGALPAPLITAYYQLAFQQGMRLEDINRVYGTLAHPNVLAPFLILMIGLTLWKLHSTWGERSFWFWGALLLSQVAVLIATGSLNALAMSLAFTVTLWLTMRGQASKLALIAALLVFVFAIWQVEPLRNRVAMLMRTRPYAELLASRYALNTFEWRLQNWDGLLQVWTRRPILGYGLGTGAMVNARFPDKAPHNDYLRFLVETGALGFVFFIGFLTLVGLEIKRMRNYDADGRGDLAPLTAICWAVYVAWLVGMTADNLMAYTSFHYYFWATLGAVTGVASFQEKQVRT